MSQERAAEEAPKSLGGSSPQPLRVDQNVALNGGDTESSQETYPICLKCSKAIHHVPYKYLGATFHAVCLKCNSCAYNLSAKHFIISGTNIFCSEVCKTKFEGAAAVTSESNHQQDTEKVSSKEANQSEGEGSTIFEVLDDIQEGNIEFQKPLKRIPILVEDEPYRLTDYPRRNSHDSPSRRSSLSISAVSESSLTSEGSSVMSYDVNRVPKKKILKHPHGQKKHSRHHVRFNLTEDESDTSSVYSFESMSTASEIYGRARSGVSDVMRGWKGEFEISPPRGSTGLTPGKHRAHPHNHRYHHHHHHHQHPHHHHLYVRPDQHWSPTLHQTHSESSLLGQPAVNGLPSPSAQSLLGGSSASPTHVMSRHAHSFSASDVPQINVNGKVMTSEGPSSAAQGLRRSTSPLTSSTFSSSDRHLQSTPLSHSFSESAISARAKSSDTSFPHRLKVLKLDSSSIPELEESTLEDRKRGHIFQFPQNSPMSQGNVSSQHGVLPSPAPHLNFQPESNNHGNLAANRMLFADDDDADDYDHLSPLKNGDEPIDEKKSTAKEQVKPPKKTSFEDALHSFLPVKKTGDPAKSTPKEDTVTSQDSAAAEDKEAPPPVPKKLRSRVQSEVTLEYKEQHLELEANKRKDAPRNEKEAPDVVVAGASPASSASKGRRKAEMRATNMESVNRAIKSTSDLDKLYPRQNLTPVREKPSTTGEGTEDSKPHQHKKRSKSPPPIPRKTTHIRRQDRDAFGNPLFGVTTLGYSSSSQSTNETNPSQETSASDTNIVPPPPEFSEVCFFADPTGPSSSYNNTNLPPPPPPEDDLAAGNSNTTLISEAASELPRESGGLPAGLSASKVISSSTSYSQKQHRNKHKIHYQHDVRAKNTDEITEDISKSSARLDPQETQAEDFVDHGGSKRVRKVVSESVLPRKSTKEVSNSVNSAKHTTQTMTPVSQTLVKDKPASSPVTDRPNTKESKSNTGKNPSVPTGRRIPSRPAPPPPNRVAASTTSSQGQSSSVANEKVTEEEKQALKLVCPPNGSKLPMMAPMVHDTEKHIQDMMAEMSTEQSRPNPMAFRMCVACTEPISSRKDFCSHEGVSYHINCFQCSRCATSLRGRSVLKVKSSLLCRECYSKTSSSSNMRLGISHRVPQNKFHGAPGSEYYAPQSGGFHPPTSGGQITSV